MDLSPGFVTGPESTGVEESDPGAGLADVGVEGDAGVVLHGSWGVGEELYLGVDHGGGFKPTGGGDGLAAAGVVVGDAGNVDGEAAAGVRLDELLPVALEATDAPFQLRGDEFDVLADAEGTVDEGAGDDGAEAGDCEGAVDGEAWAAKVGTGGRFGEDFVDFAQKRVEAVAGGGGDGDDGCLFEDGAFEGFDGLHFGEFQEVFVDEVGLGEGDEATPDVQEVEDCEVLASLGHDAFIGGDHEEGHVDAADAGEHVADEAFVARDVDD